MQSTAKAKAKRNVIYDLHHIGQLDALLEILQPFAADDMYVRQSHLYDSFVALCADTEVPYEDGDWYNDTGQAWEEYIWGVIQEKFKNLERPKPWLSDWETDFQTSVHVLNVFIYHYVFWLEQDYPQATDSDPRVVHQEAMMQTAREDMASAFYELLVLMFDVPRKLSTIADPHVYIFCPENASWHMQARDNGGRRVDYQKDPEMMDLLKHGAWLFWCGDDLHTGHADEIRVDSRIRPVLTEYARLRLYLLTGVGNQPIYAELAEAVLNAPPERTQQQDAAAAARRPHDERDAAAGLVEMSRGGGGSVRALLQCLLRVAV